MIKLPATRDDITVWRTLDDVIHIKIGDEVNSFGVTVKPDTSVMSGIMQLSEMMMRKIIGVTPHDFIMKVNDLFESEKSD